MKSILATIMGVLILAIQLNIASPVYASVNIVPQCSSSLKSTSFCSDVNNASTSNDPALEIIKTVISVISWITGIAAVILIIVSGIKFVTSGGDTNKVASAKGALINALIGIAITVLAQTIIILVIDNVTS